MGREEQVGRMGEAGKREREEEGRRGKVRHGLELVKDF